MIPKIIHYCWFGGSELPDSVQACLKTWRKWHPDYEFMMWNESNIDTSDCVYAEQARDRKKWAFLSDYVRIKKLHELGGIYFDTDVEVVQSLDKLRTENAFLGFEAPGRICTAVIGSIPHHSLLTIILDRYKTREFVLRDGSMDFTTNVQFITSIMVEQYNLQCNGREQTLKEGIKVFPSAVFSPISFETGVCATTDETVAIHHFLGSWLDERTKNAFEFNRVVNRIVGVKLGRIIISVVNRIKGLFITKNQK